MRRRLGFTLIELLVSTALLALVGIYVTQTFMSSNRAYVVVDQVAESQQSARAVADLLERDVRHAGMMVPEHAAVCGVDATNTADVLFVSDASAIDPQTDLLPYDGPRVQGVVANTPGAGVLATFTLDALTIESSAPLRAAYDTDGNGTNDSDFRENGGAIVVDLLDASRGVACGRVEDVDLVNVQVDVRMATGSLANTANPVQLAVIPAHVYEVDAQTRLFRNGALLVRGIEDLQVAYFFDLDGDNIIDAGETRGVSGANYVPAGLDHSDLRQIRLNLAARTRAEDVEFSVGQFQATENRVAPAGNDGFRRRVYTSTTMVRNVGNRI